MATNYFKKNFNYLRKRFAVTQDWLALQLGKSQSTIGGWGTSVSEPSLEKLIEISEIFGISTDYLLKVDLEKGNLITDAHVEEFEKKGKVIGKPFGKLKAGITPYKQQEEGASNQVNEPDPVQGWAQMKILKEIDGKLDQLLNRADSKGPKKV